MPSGQTHDRITIWSIPLVASVTLVATGSGNMTLVVLGGFMFGGLMFGPDLDIYSRQFQRWGWFRWIWLPYQQSLRHRSFLSHGPISGTTLRVVYLMVFIAAATGLILLILASFSNLSVNWGDIWARVRQNMSTYAREFFAWFVGCELGAMSHYLSDWTSSTYKRFQKQGVHALLPSSKIRKRKIHSRRSRSSKPKADKKQ